MTPPNRPSRRAFLGGTAAATAGVVLLAQGGDGEPRLTWASGPVYPLAELMCVIERGTLPKGTDVALTLRLDGPEFTEPRVIATDRRTIRDVRETWSVKLAYNHPHLVPGEYRYTVHAEVAGRELTSPPASYVLHPFRFGM